MDTNRLRHRVSMHGGWFFVCLVSLVITCGCSAPTSGEIGETSTTNEVSTAPWAEGEDCRNWGCLENAGAQSVLPPPSDAQACTSNGQCGSGFCVDGVCCDSACTGTCFACTAAKKGQGLDGTCGLIALYGDPDNECPNAACDGAGNCKSYNGVPCGANATCLSGTCADGVCCGNACTETCRACSAAKKGGGYDGVCGAIAAGTDPDNECLNSECNGSAACTSPTNLLNGNACTAAAQCASGYCVDGFCCGNACTETCRACSAAKKGGGYDGVCGAIAAGTDPDNECFNSECNGSAACTSPTNLLNGNACTAAAQCASGYCVDGFCCGAACTETCRACSAAKKGGGYDGVCGAIAAGTDPDNECLNAECNGSAACASPKNLLNGNACTAAAQCASGYCVDGFCCGAACTETCRACSAAKKGGGYDGVCGSIVANTDPDNECPTDCNGSGACAQVLANGSACTTGSACASGFCTDGVCCDSACTGTCEACSNAKKSQGANGVCGPIASTKNPDNECSGGYCSGFGTCVHYNGVGCAAANECMSGYCVDGVCCGNACDGTCYSCSAVKKGGGVHGQCGPILLGNDPDNECALTCDGSGACAKAGNGMTCAIGADCISGFCTDGVCCNSSCSGICEVCNAVGSEGTCTTQCPAPCSGTLGLPHAPLQSLSTVPGNLINLAQGDVNGDSFVDMIAANYATNKASIFFGQGNGVFAAPVDYPTGQEPRAVTSVDLDGDGDLDLATANNLDDNVSVLLNQGNGTFAPKVDYLAGDQPRTISAGDFNGDGIWDLVVANFESKTVSVFMNQGNGTFAAAVNHSTGSSSLLGAAAAELNGDGHVDVIAYKPGSLMVFLNQGNGTFGAKTDHFVSWNNTNFEGGMTLGDLNNDGYVDAAVTDGRSVMISLNQGNGTFLQSSEHTVGIQPRAPTTADVDGNGYLDIIVPNNLSSSANILLNQGNGVFVSGPELTTRGPVTAVVATNLNGDGQPDLVFTNGVNAAGVGSGLVDFMNLGGGTFAPGIDDYSIGATSLALATADFNGDGTLDLATSNGTISNQGNGIFGSIVAYSGNDRFTAVVTGDFNGDSHPDIVGSWSQLSVRLNDGSGAFPSAVAMLPAVFAHALVSADFNGDGKLDIAAARFMPSSGGCNKPSCPPIPSSNTMIVWLNNGNGTFASGVSYPLGGVYNSVRSVNSRTIAAADFNGDGSNDIAFAHADSNAVELLANQGNGSFASVKLITVGFPRAVEAADVNGDTKPDLIVTNSAVSSTVAVFINLGNNNFAPQVDYPVEYDPEALVITDLNGDTILDIAATTSANTVNVMFNLGNGSFGPTSVYRAGGVYPVAILAADFNSDGRADLASLNEISSTVSILPNVCLP